MGNKQKREMLDGAEQNKYKEEQKEAFREMFNKMRNACKLRKKKDIEPPKMTTTTETKKEEKQSKIRINVRIKIRAFWPLFRNFFKVLFKGYTLVIDFLCYFFSYKAYMPRLVLIACNFFFAFRIPEDESEIC